MSEPTKPIKRTRAINLPVERAADDGAAAADLARELDAAVADADAVLAAGDPGGGRVQRMPPPVQLVDRRGPAVNAGVPLLVEDNATDGVPVHTPPAPTSPTRNPWPGYPRRVDFGPGRVVEVTYDDDGRGNHCIAVDAEHESVELAVLPINTFGQSALAVSEGALVDALMGALQLGRRAAFTVDLRGAIDACRDAFAAIDAGGDVRGKLRHALRCLGFEERRRG
jgi:hypothetical protein